MIDITSVTTFTRAQFAEWQAKLVAAYEHSHGFRAEDQAVCYILRVVRRDGHIIQVSTHFWTLKDSVAMVHICVDTEGREHDYATFTHAGMDRQSKLLDRLATRLPGHLTVQTYCIDDCPE